MSAPALGARIWGILFRNEWFKVRKRLAFWLAFGFFTFIVFANYGEDFFERDPDFTLPTVWNEVFSDDGIFLIFFACIALILLTATEFTWRTARQNVIDGLSKTQWFGGKLFVLPILAAAFVGIYLLVPGVLAGIRTDFGQLAGPAIPAAAIGAAGGVLLAFLSLGALAFFLALAIRNAGGAMAVWFLWVVPGEQLIVSGLVNEFLPGLRHLLPYLPFNASLRLFEYAAYDAATHHSFLLVSAGWGLLFLLAAYLWFRRRDL